MMPYEFVRPGRPQGERPSHKTKDGRKQRVYGRGVPLAGALVPIRSYVNAYAVSLSHAE